MKTKTIILLAILFLAINAVVFYVTELNSKQKIDIILQDNLKTLQTHYNILLETQKSTAQAIYQTTLNVKGFSEIIKEAYSADKEGKARLRERLHELLEPTYKVIQKKGVLQYQFTLPNNESFYRAHKPSKFGDNLTDVRADFKYVNETLKPIRGFTQGRTAHGFRNVFPLFDREKKHIGAMEVSFSSDNFQWYLNNVSGIHTHFIVNKKIFDAKTWQRDDLVLKYENSAEAKNYMLTLNSIHTKEKCIVQNRTKLLSIREEIDAKMATGDSFSVYAKHHNHTDIIAFIPIENIEKKNIAWLVSYETSPIIESTLLNALVARAVIALLSLLIFYFLIKQIYSKLELQEKNSAIEKQHKILNDILNATDNIMIVTDFRDVKFSNNKFKDLLNIQETALFNHSSDHNMLSIFVSVDGYLHKELLNKDEEFSSLIARTPPKDRVVSILDKSLEAKAFKISVSKSENSGDAGEDYLVTLSDVTKMKEHQVQTEKKAYMDGLTKVYNRNKFDEIFQEEIQNSQKFNLPFSIAIIDIDKFKDFNDNYGHLIGDEVLIAMAHVVNEHVRGTDTFARWGGEEFVVLYKNTSLEIAKEVSEKLRAIIARYSHPIAGSVTASFGVTEYEEGDSSETIFKRCDDALYVAKENGRNRVEAL